MAPPSEIPAEFQREVCKEVKCSWSQAKKMIVEAKQLLKISSIDDATEEQRTALKTKVSELWETRYKPTPEQLEQKKLAQQQAIEREEKQKQQSRQLERQANDENFRYSVCVCVTCGLWLWCGKDGPFRNKAIREKLRGAEDDDEQQQKEAPAGNEKMERN